MTGVSVWIFLEITWANLAVSSFYVLFYIESLNKLAAI